MKIIIAFVLFFVSKVALAQQDIDSIHVITKVGKPIGEKTAIKISKDAGSLTSADGMVELIIPEGAVPKNTIISIQAITNLMANGNGKAYRLEPSGIPFKKALQLIFHYDAEEIKDSMQLLMGIAMQDDKGQWYTLNKSELDTIAKTISGNINHFSDWSNFSAIKIVPDNARLKVTNSKTLEVAGVTPSPQVNDEDLAPLERSPKNVIWKVNNVVGGNASSGTINGRKLGGYYTAPASVPNQNPVAVSANLVGLSIKFNGINFKDLRLVSNILIYDNAYEVTIVHSMKESSNGSEVGAVNYFDTGSFVIAVNGNDSKIIEKINKNTAADWGYTGKCIITKLKSGAGTVHIIGARTITVTSPAVAGGNAWVAIEFIRAPTILPLLQFKCPPVGGKGGWYTGTSAQGNAMVAQMMQAFPQRIRFEAKEGEQTILDINNAAGSVKITVRQLKEE